MTPAVPDKTDQAIVNMLAAAKRRPASPPGDDVVDYDWSSPCSLTPPQRRALKSFTDEAAASIAVALSATLALPLALEAGELTEGYAGQLTEGAGEGSSYYVSLSAAGCCGYVALDKSVARQWVAAVLGDASAGGEDRELSALETTLLGDVVATGVEAFSQALRKAGGKPVQCGRQLGDTPATMDGGPQDVCVLLPLTAEGAQNPTFTLAVKSEVLAAAAGATQARGGRNPQEMRADLRNVVEQVAVDGEVWIAATQLTMRDVMGLSEGDVVLLEGGLSDPVELTSAGRTVAWGYLAQSTGCYAMKVAGRCDEK